MGLSAKLPLPRMLILSRYFCSFKRPMKVMASVGSWPEIPAEQELCVSARI